jgi:hypothetical protein
MSSAESNIEDEKTKGQYTTRHGSHLTKTTEGVSYRRRHKGRSEIRRNTKQ